MKLKVFNPEGVHSREIKGLSALRESLPDHWFGYASFEMIGHEAGEIDLIICADDRLIVVEIKDWNGSIEDRGNIWITSGREETSPVVTIVGKAKKLKSKLKNFLPRKYDTPWIDSCVLLTGAATRAPLRSDSREKTFELEFFKKIGTKGTFQKGFPKAVFMGIPRAELKEQLDEFFSVARVRPQTLTYAGYKAQDDPCYVHPKRIYSEFIAEKPRARGYRALLRCWNFGELANHDPIYLNAENRKVLALREENAIGYLRDAKPDFTQRNVFLNQIDNAGRDTITENFFELYDLPTNLSRLKESLQRFGDGLKDDNRVSLCRVLLSHFSELHELEVTHRDIGEHCIWVSIPDKVTLSGFATSSFPEQKSVSQIRETIRAGAERIPEDVLDSPSDNYRKDVFLLGSVIHQILFGRRPEIPDGFPTWAEPANGKFKRFWRWFERSLEMEPDKRFPNAMAAFEDFQRCDGLEKRPSVSADDFQEFSRSQLPFPNAEDETLSDDDHGLVFQTTSPEHGLCLVKVWANARFSIGSTEANSQLLEFFKRIQRLKIKELSAQQKILDFGHTRYGSYVVLRWEQGKTLDKCEFAECEDEEAIGLVVALVNAVSEMHGAGFYHGDLKPENILLIGEPDEKADIRIIDSIDFSPNGTQRRSPAYAPPEGEAASIPVCDGYAAWKIVTHFLFSRMPCVSEQFKQAIGDILESILAVDAGNPDFAELLRELVKIAENKDAKQDISSQEILITMGGIAGDILLTPDDRGLPVEVYSDREQAGCLKIFITTPHDRLLLRYDSALSRLTKIRRFDSCLLDFTGSMKRNAALLKHPIRVMKGNFDNLEDLQDSLQETGVVSKGLELIPNKVKSPDLEKDGADEPDELAGETQPEPSVEEPDAGLEQVELRFLWKSLIEAESSLLPIVTITAEPVVVEASGIISIPIGEPTKPFEFHDEEPIQVETRDREGQWRYYGNLDNRRTRPGALAIRIPKKGTFIPSVSGSLRLENQASRASYDKRQAATNRLIEGKSVCPDLYSYYATTPGLSSREARFATRFKELDRYDLNHEQRDALETALSSSPLSMIQGPPGTGKTSVLSAAAHYIATNYRSAKILVVSQSHEAIDHATEQIVKRFRKHGEEPSLVRVGRRAAVSDQLISFHSESLQSEYRERFRLSLSERISPVGARLGLTDALVGELTILRSRLVPILRQLDLNQDLGDSQTETSSVTARNLLKACLQLDPKFVPDNIKIGSIYGHMEQRLATRYGETNLVAIAALRTVIDLALDWIQTLEVPGKLDRFYVGSCQIVTGTCVGIGRWDLGLESETFDCVIIDEAARCGPGDLAVASQVAEQVILLGDHKQLPPYMDKEVADIVSEDLGCKREIVARSDFYRLFCSDYAIRSGRTLKTQYRMREPIGKLVSTCFYPEVGGLEPGRHASAEVYGRLPSGLENHVTWVDTGTGAEERVGTSFVNRHEIDRIMKLLEELASAGDVVDELALDAMSEALPAAIGIIAAYKAQADAIEERIWTSSLPERLRATCKVGTVDSYQGKENPIVIFSAVRCNSYEEIGFTRSWERVNVSLSRARERLIVVGSWNFWLSTGEESPLGKVAKYIDGCIACKESGYGFLEPEEIEK